MDASGSSPPSEARFVLSELERQIGFPPGTNIDPSSINLNGHLRLALCAWLNAKGIPARGNNSTEKASAYSISRAYASEKYLAGWLKNIHNPNWNASRARRNSLESLLEEPEPARSPSGSTAEASLFGENNTLPREARGETSNSESKVDAADINALVKIIENKIDYLSGELRGELSAKTIEATGNLQSALAEALADVEITNKLKEQIRALARESAEAYASELFPRRLELITNTDTRILDPEPRHRAFDEILAWLSSGSHVYIVGPAGTGKTHLFSQLAKALDKRLIPIGQSLTKYDLSGYKGPTGEYIGTLMRDAIESGGLVAIDEGDTWAAAALAFLNTALANNYCPFPDKVVEVHPNFQCIIAANTFGRGANHQYVGRNPLDAASLDRFAYVEVDYDNDMERQIYGASAWVEYVQKVREACATLKLPHIVSMRATERCLKGAALGLPSASIAFANLWRGLERDSIQKIKNLCGEPPEGK